MKIFFFDRFNRWNIFLERVDLAAVFPESIAKMGSGNQSGGPHITDDVSLFNFHSRPDSTGDSGHMKILGRIDAVMFYFDIPAVF